MIKIEGKGGISATIVADSVSPTGIRLTTFEFVFHRLILAEVNTHRMLSKNAASTRAVPIESVLNLISESPAMPIHWGENQSGMSAKTELIGTRRSAAEGMWVAAARSAASFAKVLSDKIGVNGHKQWVGRMIETYTMTKQVISGTSWENFFWLRYHPDAQPEFQELAKCAKQAMDLSTPVLLQSGEWHLPYIEVTDGQYFASGELVDLDTAKTVSVSCCAQVSYRRLDDTIEKAKKIFSMLNIGSTVDPCHASPLEHIATPLLTTSVERDQNLPFNPDTWEPGITHVRKNGSLWSGNYEGWVQYRQLVPNEAVW